MKKYINKLIVSGLLGFGLYACGESFLETRPSDQFSDSSVFTDLESAQTVLVGAYDMFSNGWYAHYLNQDMLFHADIRADDALVSPNPNFNYGRFVASYQYLQVIPTLNNVRDSWLMSYKLIDLCNGLLDNLPNFAESPERDKMEGEARVLRAYVYHFLVRTYAKAVKHFPQSPGVILRTTQGTDDMPRSTVAEVYELMKEDVEKATSLLANSESKIYFDKRAAHAVAARVYLDLGDATNGIRHANAALEGITLMNQTDYTTKFCEINSETLWAFTCPPNDVQTYLSIPAFWYLADGHDGTKFTNEVIGYSSLRVSQGLIDIFDEADIRIKQFPKDSKGNWLRAGESAPSEEDGIITTKWRSRGSLGVGDFNMLRGSEMYLIIAELAADAGRNDEALAALNTLRAARGLDAYTGSDLINEIQNERRRELFAEGHRLFDLKRRNLPMNRQGVEGHDLWANPLNLPAGSDWFEFPIPQEEIDANKALTKNDQNPQYQTN